MAKQLPYQTLVEIFTRFREAEPEPKGELEHLNAYTLVVAVALSAQATDVGVNKATKELFKIADTPEKMLLDGPIHRPLSCRPPITQYGSRMSTPML